MCTKKEIKINLCAEYNKELKCAINNWFIELNGKRIEGWLNEEDERNESSILKQEEVEGSNRVLFILAEPHNEDVRNDNGFWFREQLKLVRNKDNDQKNPDTNAGRSEERRVGKEC